MKKITVFLLMILISMTSANFSLANEKKNHTCFRIVDSNKDGEITFQEFEKFFGNDTERFKKADLNKNGRLSHDEYHELLGHGS
ncbi:MAG: EF-hand domain-containing protein [Desulfobacteraceae bacterium]|nr:EF-hand domain-containing protein [Desulfobacteraceae bacterium]MDH3574472.1 EF-hand domain-containing protein [Desulfobacteraceae bacterium]MDH3721378.1 EF-hand domain-containing protein [Desulfobacteraceae bacterium]MDH3838191.1 EF-hand domain-containing protein [Desulfobacteraceae bacterium]MDH3875440.1 EF-hand domain-containing protein [Desulfobacteraceae bacterium]